VAHVAGMHWNLLRVQHWPTKELQLFEPMGKPASRHGKTGDSSVSLRYIPKHIIHWLDTCWPIVHHENEFINNGGKGFYWGNVADRFQSSSSSSSVASSTSYYTAHASASSSLTPSPASSLSSSSFSPPQTTTATTTTTTTSRPNNPKEYTINVQLGMSPLPRLTRAQYNKISEGGSEGGSVVVEVEEKGSRAIIEP
jgi:hypothetical protein